MLTGYRLLVTVDPSAPVAATAALQQQAAVQKKLQLRPVPNGSMTFKDLQASLPLSSAPFPRVLDLTEAQFN